MRILKQKMNYFGILLVSETQQPTQNQAHRGIVQLAAVLGVIRTLRIVEQRPEWRRAHLALVEPDDERRLFKASVLATMWGSDSLAHRALSENDGEWFDELSMVTGLLAWLAWDVGIDIEDVSKMVRPEEVGDEVLYSFQLLAALGPWLIDDVTAGTTLKESVARTPRLRVDEHEWLRNLESRLGTLRKYRLILTIMGKLDDVLVLVISWFSAIGSRSVCGWLSRLRQVAKAGWSQSLTRKSRTEKEPIWSRMWLRCLGG